MLKARDKIIGAGEKNTKKSDPTTQTIQIFGSLLQPNPIYGLVLSLRNPKPVMLLSVSPLNQPKAGALFYENLILVGNQPGPQVPVAARACIHKPRRSY